MASLGPGLQFRHSQGRTLLLQLHCLREREIAEMGELYEARVKVETDKKPEHRLALHQLLHGVALTVLPDHAVPPFGPVFD